MQNFTTLNNAIWKIGDISIQGRLILAPMEGISDQPYRVICRRLGAAISYTEFVSAIEILNKHPYRVDQRIAFCEEERPFAIQVFDNEPERLVRAVKKLLPIHPDIIDINMGCSAKTVSNRGAGAGLLRTPEKIEAIFSMLTNQLSIPITGKIRLGWDDSTLNYLEVAKIVENNGGAALGVHGRTRKQSYTGKANWDAIAEVKQAISIPVIANGDVKTPKDVIHILDHTGADAVMIGRKAIGNPWIFSGIPQEEVPYIERIKVMHQHIQAMADFYTEHTGVVLFRKHAVAYLQQYPMAREEKDASDYNLSYVFHGLSCFSPVGEKNLNANHGTNSAAIDHAYESLLQPLLPYRYKDYQPDTLEYPMTWSGIFQCRAAVRFHHKSLRRGQLCQRSILAGFFPAPSLHSPRSVEAVLAMRLQYHLLTM